MNTIEIHNVSSIVACTMNIITPGRHQLCAWFIMLYIMCYVYCEHHYDEYVRCYEYLSNIMCYVYHDRFDEYLGRL